MEKLDSKVVYNYFKNLGYSIVGEYQNANSPVICEKGEYRYRISYSNLKMGKKPSLWGLNNIANLDYNIESFMRKRNSKAIYLGHEIVTKKQKKRILLHFQCECGEKFDRILEDLVHKTYILCPQCTVKKRGKSKRLGKKVVDFIEKNGYIVLDKNNNYRNSDYVEVEDSEGYRGFVTYAHLSSNHGAMSKFDIRVNKKHYVDNVNHYAQLKGLNVQCLEVLEEKLHSRQSLKFRCSCGNEFVTSLASFQNGKTRCNVCAKSESRYEFIFENYLKQEGLDYIFQYSLNQCRDTLPLPFDFYIKDYNCLIEIDGEGHYHPCNFNQISNEDAMKSFILTQNHDKIKTEFCKDNNIPLLRISYKDFAEDKYKQLFQNFIGELANSG